MTLYDTQQVIEKTGVSIQTIYRWAGKLRRTDMVRRAAEGKNAKWLFSSDFVTFIRARTKGRGPQGLPAAETVEQLFQLWHKYEDVKNVAGEMEQPVELVEYRLNQIGINTLGAL